MRFRKNDIAEGKQQLKQCQYFCLLSGRFMTVRNANSHIIRINTCTYDIPTRDSAIIHLSKLYQIVSRQTTDISFVPRFILHENMDTL